MDKKPGWDSQPGFLLYPFMNTNESRPMQANEFLASA